MPHNTTPHPTDDTKKRGASIAAKKAMGSQLEGASDDEGEDSASDDEGEDSASDSGLYSASDDEGDDGEEGDGKEGDGEEGDAASDSGRSGYGFDC